METREHPLVAEGEGGDVLLLACAPQQGVRADQWRGPGRQEGQEYRG